MICFASQQRQSPSCITSSTCSFVHSSSTFSAWSVLFIWVSEAQTHDSFQLVTRKFQLLTQSGTQKSLYLSQYDIENYGVYLWDPVVTAVTSLNTWLLLLPSNLAASFQRHCPVCHLSDEPCRQFLLFALSSVFVTKESSQTNWSKRLKSPTFWLLVSLSAHRLFYPASHLCLFNKTGELFSCVF